MFNVAIRKLLDKINTQKTNHEISIRPYFSYANTYTPLNTPRVIVNANNQRRWTWYAEQAEAFGANRPNEKPNKLMNGVTTQLGAFQYHLRFPGQLFDPATGLSYNYSRDYNPRTGRYLESDLIGLAGGINTYGYVAGNPLSRIDPDGRFAVPFIYYEALGVATLATAWWMAQHPVVPSGVRVDGDASFSTSNGNWPFDYPKPTTPTDTVPVVSTPTNYPTKDPSKCNQQFEDDMAKCKQTCPEPVSFSRLGCVAKAFAKLRVCNRIYKPAGSDWTD